MTVSIIIPIHNGASTLQKALRSLFQQHQKIDQLIFINDGSTDRSLILVESLCQQYKYTDYRIITHSKARGLAASYNEGIKAARSDLVVTMHQDVIIEKDSLAKLIQPLQNQDDDVVAAWHVVIHPVEIWEKYNFWQKCFFARQVNKNYSGLDGKFDCFRESALIKAGYFDQASFRTAGEDGDMINRLKKIGRLVPTEARIIHLHQADNRFGIKQIIRKQAQYSEAQGVMLRKGIIKEPRQLLRAFFRELLLVLLLLPDVRIIGIAMIVVYSFLYTKIVYLKEYKDPRIIILPGLNVLLLFVSFYFSVSGFIRSKQTV